MVSECITFSSLVLEKPSFVEIPEEQEITEEENLELVCKATGRELPNVFWYFNNKELVPGDNVVIETYEDTSNDYTTSMLTVKNTEPKAHTGKYKMEATNRAGKVKHEVKVKGKGQKRNINIS